VSWLGDLARDLGDEAARSLAQSYGGTSIYVPGSLSPRLVAMVGRDIAQWLVDHHGGQKLYVPMPDLRQRDAERARELHHMGTRPGDIARLIGRSERWVARVLRGE